MTVDLAEITTPAPDPGPADWNDEGVVILPRFLPAELLDAYADEWKRANRFHGVDANGILVADHPSGWEDCTPYMRFPALRALVCEELLAGQLAHLLGEPAGVHLNLTGWVTTTRDWHQDSYLNPPHVGDYYAAAWIALEDVDPDSGVFQYVPGSHRWPQVTRELIGRYLDLTDPRWPTLSEAILSPLFVTEMERRGAAAVSYVPRKGDVLLWHGRLLHRGSLARTPGLYRPALIAHYSGIHHRSDMPPAVQSEHGGWYFPIDSRTPVR